jgi:hypothetical protein
VFHAPLQLPRQSPSAAGGAWRECVTGSGAVADSGICCGFWYYTNDDELSDIVNGTVWSANEWEDGVANGNSVYAWHNQCTPAGLGVAIDNCFTNFNGGVAPTTASSTAWTSAPD